MSAAPRGFLETRRALEALDHGRERQRELVAQIEHEREALNVAGVPGLALRKRKPPPGAQVWTLPGEPVEAGLILTRRHLHFALE